MLNISTQEIIRRIENREILDATASDAGFRIVIKEYVPFACAAIHDGHRLRNELKMKIALTDYERWYEEDPSTADFISSMPIVLVGKDSRFEYDLNRSPEAAIYKEAWGKKVWKKALKKDEKVISLQKHHLFYKVVETLIRVLDDSFGGCVVYDIHSYNHVRWEREVPVFNIGSERVDQDTFGKMVRLWKKQLSEIELPNGIVNNTAINDVFFGRGYFLEFITRRFPRCLVLATEISKIYCNEESGELYPEIIKTLRSGLKKAIVSHAESFVAKHTRWERTKKNTLLSRDLSSTLKSIDRQLFENLKDFELLSFVNPINIQKQKKLFFESRCTLNPEFVYRPIHIDPFELKRKIHAVELERIDDIHIQRMYEHVISSFSDKIDLLATLGQERFLYNSLRYFGKPNEIDLKNAWFLQHLPEIEEPRVEKKLGTSEALELFSKELAAYGFSCKVEVTKHIVADAMVSNSQKKVMLKKGATFTEKSLKYLAHHEIGVHMVTTMNALEQPLRILQLGFPVNTKTQEGLAVLSEFLSGNAMLPRLKELGLRVIATDMLANGAKFTETYDRMVNDLKVDVDSAFYLVTRIYRGGGFTKDHLYLRGLREIFQFWNEGNDLRPLLLGKVSLEYYPILVELLERGILKAPMYVTSAFEHPTPELNNPIYSYILKGIR